ncbi:MAG: phenylacetate-CoA ligase [Solirubrobacteraceae bacterium]|jgi:phenylacetate-CoA ligase|nr:phenylacetate-CoA ligase [Solirubrobacteraceae bacterium]
MTGTEPGAGVVDRPQGGWRGARYWDETWQRMSREQLDEIHLRRIRQLIAYAYERVPFYRRLYDEAGVHPDDIRTMDDFHERIPFVDKPEVMADQEASESGFGLESVPRERRAWFHRTSGTTGVPLNEVFTSYDRLVAAYEGWTYGWWDMGLRPGDSMYFAFNFGTFIGFWSALFSAERLGLLVIPGGGLDTRARLRQILDLRPDAVIGTPTYLLHMGDIAREEGIDLASADVRLLSTAGEIGPNVPSFRRALRESWGNPRICDIYGISEPIFAACECSAVDEGAANGLHVIERYIHSYVVDPATFRPVQDESEVGEHIVTSFRLGQPLIKYRTHDLVRLQRTPDHGCGWGFAFLDGGVLARLDGMVTIRGVNIYTTAVSNIIGSVPGASPHYELHITREHGQDAMEVRVEATTAVTDRDGLRARLAGELRDRLMVTMAVDVCEPGALPRYELKSRRIFDHRGEEGP